jgi:hypothetical protein
MKITIDNPPAGDLREEPFPMALCYDEPGFDFEVPFGALLQTPNSQMQINNSYVFNFPDPVFRSLAEHLRENRPDSV